MPLLQDRVGVDPGGQIAAASLGEEFADSLGQCVIAHARQQGGDVVGVVGFDRFEDGMLDGIAKQAVDDDLVARDGEIGVESRFDRPRAEQGGAEAVDRRDFRIGQLLSPMEQPLAVSLAGGVFRELAKHGADALSHFQGGFVGECQRDEMGEHIAVVGVGQQ